MANQPTGLIYRCPVHGDQHMPMPVTRDAIVDWWIDMESRHGKCGRKEPPCPVERGDYGWYLRGTSILEEAAVAIAFQYAVEERMAKLVWVSTEDCVRAEYWIVHSRITCNTPTALVKSIWPETFKDLEVDVDA